MAVADLAVTARPAPPLADAAALRRVRAWFVVLSVLALASFVLGVRNRLTAGGLFLFPPQIDWLPPLSTASWWEAAVAGVLVSAVRPPVPPDLRPAGPTAAAWLWGGAVLLAVLTGALFAARDATGVWTTWPGYEGSAFPPADRLLSFSPPWLNLIANQYTIQLAHRLVAAGLWLASLAWLVAGAVDQAGDRRHAQLGTHHHDADGKHADGADLEEVDR